MRRLGWVVPLLVLCACSAKDGDGTMDAATGGDGGSPADASGGTDAGPPDDGGGADAGAGGDGAAGDAGGGCRSAGDCDDGLFCNGEERCAAGEPGAGPDGCVAAAAMRCLPGQTCDEESDRCLSECDVDADTDDDGVTALECGGTDCDDSRAEAFPGAAERCNGDDDDCDERVDEDPAVMECAAPGAMVGCIDGECTVTGCEPGLDDCNGDPGDGCEADLGSTATCGRCDVACAEGERCIGGRCRGALLASTLTAGDFHNCAVLADATVACWGGAYLGQLGDGLYGILDATFREEPVRVAGLTGIVEVAAGRDHTCGRAAGGEVSCWGWASEGQLGNGTTALHEATTPVRAMGLSGVVQLEGGGQQSCARLAGGRVQCWGGNSRGELGDGSGMQRLAPTDVPGITTAIEIAAGPAHTCAVLGSGEVRCWGENGSRQLGDGTAVLYSLSPVVARDVTGAVEVDAGFFNTCVRLATGRVQCWGRNDFGQIGDGTRGFAVTATDVLGLDDAVQIGLGEQFACALRATGAVACWGRNDHGEQGDGGGTDVLEPRDVAGIDDAVEIAVGGLHACARRVSGAIACWGTNTIGTLGRGSFASTPGRPAAVAGLCGAACDLDGPGCDEDPCDEVLPVAQVVAGANHTCARQLGGRTFCWGRGELGTLGDGSMRYDQRVPRRALGLTDVTHLAAGHSHTCVLREDGTAACFGMDGSGQLGAGTTAPFRSTAVTVAGLDGAVALAPGLDHTCALLGTGEARCWGDNAYGQLGDRRVPADSLAPSRVDGLTDATAIASGNRFTCAVRRGGGVDCWGHNADGQLGLGSTFPSTRGYPGPVMGLAAVVQVAAGANHACAVHGSGAVSCWGRNSDGQLGDGSRMQRSAPVPVTGIDDAVEVQAGSVHTCARRDDGTVSCWGDNARGQLGVAAGSESLTPVAATGVTAAIGLAARGEHTCVLHAGGTLSCFGMNFFGQLGDRTTADRRTAAPVIGLP